MGRLHFLKPLLVSLCVTALSVTAAAAFTDTQGHPAEAAIQKWSAEYGVMSGYADGSFRPHDPVTKGEFAGILDRLMRFRNKSDPSVFRDISGDYWADALLKAHAYALMPETNGYAEPAAFITRQQAVTMIARAFNFPAYSIIPRYADDAEIAGYARSAVSEMAERGYLEGVADGDFRPEEPISRADILRIFDNIIDVIVFTEAPLTRNVDGGVLVNCEAGATLRNIRVDGDLYIAPGVVGTVLLDNVSVSGETYNLSRGATVETAEAAEVENLSADAFATYSLQQDEEPENHGLQPTINPELAPPEPYAPANSGQTYYDPGETTHDPGRARDSGGTADSGRTPIDPGETTYDPNRPPDSGRTPADSGATTPAPVQPVDNGNTTDSGRTQYDSGETTHDPGRTKDSGQTKDSGRTSDSGKTADSGKTQDSGKTTDSGKTKDTGRTSRDTGRTKYDPGVTGDPGETTASPVRPSDSGSADSGKTSIDPGETTENPENQAPTNSPSAPSTPSAPSAPSGWENPENQLPIDLPSYTPPYTPLNTDYGTLPNKPVSQWTISDVYTPGVKNGKYFTFEGTRFQAYYGVQTRNVYSGEFVWRVGHRLRYVGNRYDAKFGVDVSAYQNRDRSNQTINWAAAKADGVQFAMIRVGLRGTSTGILHEDAYYARNIDGAMAQGIQTGVYIFAQAKTIAEAVEEADFVIARLRGHKINGPVSYDWEMKDKSYRVYGTSPEMATACAVAFCKRVAAAGYTPMVYNSRYVAYYKYDQGALAPYMMWYPQYPSSDVTYPYPNFYYQMDYWQYTDRAVVEGIGQRIDANIWFKPKS